MGANSREGLIRGRGLFEGGQFEDLRYLIVNDGSRNTMACLKMGGGCESLSSCHTKGPAIAMEHHKGARHRLRLRGGLWGSSHPWGMLRGLSPP